MKSSESQGPLQTGLGLYASGANRVTLQAALRATAAAAVPLLLLSATGHPQEGLFATIAVLNIAIADSGGPYRQRLHIMLAIALIVPLVLMLGMRARAFFWLPPLGMFAVAMVGGFTRLLGAGGTALGLITGIIFLVGVEVPGDWNHALISGLSYLGGAGWSLLVTLLVWRLRPYRRVRYEIGESFRQLAISTHWLSARCVMAGGDCQVNLMAAQSGVREALGQAELTLGSALSETDALAPFLSDLIVLLRAASRIQASLTSLGGALEMASFDQLSGAEQGEIRRVLEQIETGCRNLATGLLEKVSPYEKSPELSNDERWPSIDLPTGDHPALEEAESFVNVIRRQLELSHRVLDRVAGQRNQMGVLPPLFGGSFATQGWSAIRANLSFQSLVFRHALRVAVASTVATAIYLIWNIPHGIWIPLTVLIVLQPQFGATLNRALHRTGGTLLGGILAAALVWAFGHGMGLNLGILACLFLTVLFLRRHYWLAVVFLTPMIILLLSTLLHHPWADIAERILNTLAGAVVALVAGFLLWPNWEIRRLPEEVAAGVKANRQYLNAVFTAVAHGVQPGWPLAGLRNQAELGSSNARACLDRALSEPWRMRREITTAMAVITHLERLTRHVTRLSIYLHQVPGLKLAFGTLGTTLDQVLVQIETALLEENQVEQEHHLEQAYGDTRRSWQESDQPGLDWRIVDSLVSSIVADVNSLHAALRAPENSDAAS